MKIEIKGHINDIQTVLAVKELPKPGDEFRLADTFECLSVSGGDRNFSQSDVLLFVLQSGWSVGLSILATHLYNTFRELKEAELRINDEFVAISEEEIQQALEKAAESDEQS